MLDKIVPKKELKLKTIIDYILILLLLIISIKKGGFYKTDTLFFSLGVTILGIITITYNLLSYIYNKTVKKVDKIDFKFDFISLLLFVLTLAYSLAILFKNYTDLTSAIYEMIRYFNLYIIYIIVKNSDNKKIYLNGIIVIAVIQAIIGIDSIASRYLEPYLNIINSGYLLKDLERMSSTIQYANVFAIFQAIATIFIIDKLAKLDLTSINSVKKKVAYVVNYTMLNLCISSVILTFSRTVYVLLLIAILVYILKLKENKKQTIIILLSTFIQIMVYTALIANVMNRDINNIYYILIVGIISFAFIGYLLMRVFSGKTKLDTYIENLNIFKVVSYCLLIIAIYLLIAFSLPQPLIVNSDSNNIVTRRIYNIEKNNENNLKIKVNTFDADTRYKISIQEVDSAFKGTLLKEFNYYDTVSNECNINFTSSEKSKFILIEFSCSKGTIGIDNVIVNNKKENLSYNLLPDETVFRIRDFFKGSTSTRDRLEYYKDALKIIKKEPINILVGVGGDGFNNLYESVQTLNYTSTEVHNSFLQIFLESGILGILSIATILIIVIIKKENDVCKLVTLMLMTHMLFDLDFSYIFIIAIFGILLGLTKSEERSMTNKYVKIIILFTLLVITIIGLEFLLKSNIAYYMKLPKQSNNIQEQEEIIKNYQRRVNLDKFEITYINDLNEQYIHYLELLQLENNQKKSAKIFQEINKNIEKIRVIGKKNIQVKINTINFYKNSVERFNMTNNLENINSEIEYIKNNVAIESKLQSYNLP